MHPVFFEIHSGLEREAPGSPESTRKALALIRDLPAPARILDVGCGPGAQALELARGIQGQVTAVDNHPPFIDAVQERAAAAGLADRIDARTGDMTALPFAPGSFDLIWSEGAIYIMGFRAGLEAWRPLLAPGGYLAVSEATWLKPEAPEACRTFWDAGYPAMTDIPANIATTGEAGFRDIGHFALPATDWWAYYDAVSRRIDELEQRHGGDAEALAVLAEERQEIELYRRYSDWYGYVFYVMQRTD